MRLTSDRAAAVVAFLIKKGVDKKKLQAAGYGEYCPVDKGQNEAAWEKNRRVEFKVLSIDGNNPIINAGTDDSVTSGDLFTVYASESDVRVGKLRVLTVWAAHLSQCEFLDGKDTVRPDDYIMPQE